MVPIGPRNCVTPGDTIMIGYSIMCNKSNNLMKFDDKWWFFLYLTIQTLAISQYLEQGLEFGIVWNEKITLEMIYITFN